MEEHERESIKQRKQEGIKIAKFKGKHLERTNAQALNQWEEIYKE